MAQLETHERQVHSTKVRYQNDMVGVYRAFHLNQRGFSIIEGLIAAGMIAVIAIAVSSIGFNQTDSTKYKRACSNIVNSIIDSSTAAGPYYDIVNMQPMGANRTMANRYVRPMPFPPTNPNLTDPINVDQSQYWFFANPLAGQVTGTLNPAQNSVYLGSANLIQGSVRTINAIYNSYPSTRCNDGWTQPNNFPPLTDLSPAHRNLLNSNLMAALPAPPDVQINIKPYDRFFSYEFPSCPNQVHIGPATDFRGDVAKWGYFPGTAQQSVPTGDGWPTNASSPNNVLPAYPNPGGYSTPIDIIDPNKNPNLPTFAPDQQLIRTIGGLGLFTIPGIATTYGQRGWSDETMALMMKVRVSFNTPTGENVTCFGEQRYEYPADKTQPVLPDILRVAAGSNTSLAQTICADAPSNDIALEIGYSAAAGMERGTQLFCRDLSYMRGFNSYPIGASPVFDDPNAPDPIFASTNGSSIPCFMNGAYKDEYNQIPNALLSTYTNRQRNAAGNAVWVPCDQLMQCGRMPSSYAINEGGAVTAVTTDAPNNSPFTDLNGNGVPDVFRINYTGMPTGCIMGFEVAAVDPAGNRSAFPPAGVADPLNARRFLNINSNPIGDSAGADVFIRRPMCGVGTIWGSVPGRGVWCHPAAAAGWAPMWDPADLANFPNGYFTCRAGGCCVGAGCRPWSN